MLVNSGWAGNLRRVCLLGNCQAQSLEAWIIVDAPGIQVDRVDPVWLIEEAQRVDIEAKFNSADLIFAQRLSEEYHLAFLRPSSLRSRYGSKVLFWPNIYFDGYFPGLQYKYRVDGTKVFGPLDEYHFDFLLDGYQKGVPVQEMKRNFLDESIFEHHPDPITQSIAQLAGREVDLDIIISDWICQNLGGNQLFFAMNHPTNILLREMMKRLFAAASISNYITRETEFQYTLDKIIIPIFGGISAKYNLRSMLPVGEFKGVELDKIGGRWVSSPRNRIYDSHSLVECYYRVYDDEGFG